MFHFFETWWSAPQRRRKLKWKFNIFWFIIVEKLQFLFLFLYFFSFGKNDFNWKINHLAYIFIGIFFLYHFVVDEILRNCIRLTSDDWCQYWKYSQNINELFYSVVKTICCKKTLCVTIRIVGHSQGIVK